MGKILALLYGVATYGFFFITFLYAIAFVGNFGGIVSKTIDSGIEGELGGSLIINIILLGLFGGQHLIMARPAFKAKWTKIVPEPVERTTFVLAATALLALLIWKWQPLTTEIWTVTSTAGAAILQVLFFAGWAIVLLATFMIDHFDLFGLRQVYLNFKGQPYTHKPFVTVGFYKFVRHPLMLGFIIAFWATPAMSLGHLVFAIVTTVYILISLPIEERDLAAALGAPYEAYRKRVSMLIPMPPKKG